MAHELAGEAGRKNQTDDVPVALRPWAEWYGEGALKPNAYAIDKYAGGSLAGSAIHNYECRYRKRGIYRGVNNLSPYLTDAPNDADAEEECACLTSPCQLARWAGT